MEETHTTSGADFHDKEVVRHRVELRLVEIGQLGLGLTALAGGVLLEHPPSCIEGE